MHTYAYIYAYIDMLGRSDVMRPDPGDPAWTNAEPAASEPELLPTVSRILLSYSSTTQRVVIRWKIHLHGGSINHPLGGAGYYSIL